MTDLAIFNGLLAQFHSKSQTELKAALAQTSMEQRYALVEYSVLADEIRHPTAATSWLIKYCSDVGDELSKTAKFWLQRYLIEADDWHTQLHILQVLEAQALLAELNKQQLAHVFNRLHYLLSAENKFVRAWAFNGLIVIAAQVSEYKKPVSEMLRLAVQTEPPAVQARIRAALKKYRL